MLSPEGSCDVAILACTCANFVVIPGGITRQLQTLDISVSHLKKGYKSWLWSENLSLISSSWIKKAPASKLEEWRPMVWKKILKIIAEYSLKQVESLLLLVGRI